LIDFTRRKVAIALPPGHPGRSDHGKQALAFSGTLMLT